MLYFHLKARKNKLAILKYFPSANSVGSQCLLWLFRQNISGRFLTDSIAVLSRWKSYSSGKKQTKRTSIIFEEIQPSYDSLNVASLGICNPLRKKQQQWEKRLRKS